MVIKSLIGNDFVRQAKIHGDKTQVEMAKLWDGEISDRTISRALKKIGFTRKKRPMAFQERDEVKRKAFIANLSSVDPDRIVYLDESDQYDYGGNERSQRFYALKSGRPEGLVNTIANALCGHNLIVPFTVERAYNRTVFETKARNKFASNTASRTSGGDG